MNKEFSPKLVDIYIDFAIHLLSIPEIQQLGDDVIQWLSERVLTGLPTVDAWDHRSRLLTFDSTPARVMNEFMFSNADDDDAPWFIHHMKLAALYLVDAGLPSFPRETELQVRSQHRLL